MEKYAGPRHFRWSGVHVQEMLCTHRLCYVVVDVGLIFGGFLMMLTAEVFFLVPESGTAQA
jgi:hypothetical protein